MFCANHSCLNCFLCHRPIQKVATKTVKENEAHDDSHKRSADNPISDGYSASLPG